MKKNLLIVVLGLLCFTAPVQAQLQKGTKFAAATISLSGYNNRPKYDRGNVSNFNQISFNPSIQFGNMIRDHVMAGVTIGSSLYFAWAKSKPTTSLPDYKESRQSYTLSPFIRHYKSLGPKWAIFLHSAADVSFLHSRSNILSIESIDNRENGFSAGIRVVPGIVYWVTPRFALESDLNFLSLSAGYRSFQDNNSLYFNSVVTSDLSSYFSLRASWYLQKP